MAVGVFAARHVFRLFLNSVVALLDLLAFDFQILLKLFFCHSVIGSGEKWRLLPGQKVFHGGYISVPFSYEDVALHCSVSLKIYISVLTCCLIIK